MSKADKKQRHRAKREAKRRDMRRREGISPLKRLGDAPGEVECWMSHDIEEFGQCTMFAYKRGAGLKGFGCFLVDVGVVGLKDAWYRLDMEHSEFEEMLEATRERGIPIGRASLDQIRAMIAGGARWAHDNGMRLPKEWIKTAMLLGGVGDWQHADVSGFKKEFAGHPEDLRQRLIRESFESYIRRPDVSFVFSEDAPFKDQETGEYAQIDDDQLDDDEIDEFDEQVNPLFELFAPLAAGLAVKTIEWLRSRHLVPSTELVQAWLTLIVTRSLSRVGVPETARHEADQVAFDFIENLRQRIDPADQTAYDIAVGQVLEHVKTDPQVVQRELEHLGGGGPSLSSPVA